ncbi:hypothetical protein [Hymenobacter edaphi]|uniref:hypothetical protein n=1 Tax=Hymenobacter edaphi TaxID=2211146 RepID=UPI001057B8BA|nr:hypothetical protein [Hymenobacter edaphi]
MMSFLQCFSYKTCNNNDLNNKMVILYKSYNEKKYYIFFNNFPSNFNNLIYSYDYNARNKNNLYNLYDKHIPYFFDSYKTGRVGVDEIIKKIYPIACEGRWSADAVDLFQNCLRKMIVNETPWIIQELKKHSNDRNTKFWHFVLDGSPSLDKQIKVIYNDLYKAVSKQDPKQAYVMKLEFNRMYNLNKKINMCK